MPRCATRPFPCTQSRNFPEPKPLRSLKVTQKGGEAWGTQMGDSAVLGVVSGF